MTSSRPSRTLDEFRADLLREPGFREAAEKGRVAVAIANAVTLGRARRGWNQAQLASESGADVSEIIEIENGRHNATIETLRLLANALGIAFVIEPQSL